MTLLDPTANGDIANKPFAEKKSINATSPLLITQEVAGSKKWEPDAIEERQVAMADDALKIWTINVPSEVDSSELQQAIEHQHLCLARLVQSVPVREKFTRETVWEGVTRCGRR